MSTPFYALPTLVRASSVAPRGTFETCVSVGYCKRPTRPWLTDVRCVHCRHKVNITPTKE
jgi:hypothetical protein